MDKEIFKRTMLYSVIAGLVTHGYFIFNFLYSNDSLQMLYISGAGDESQIALGRPFNTLYNWLTSTIIAVPFLQGLSVILWLAVAAYFFIQIFEIKDNIRIALVAGLFESNLAVLSLLAAYAPDAAPSYFGVMLATIAAWFWNRYISGKNIKDIVLASVLLGSALAIYQCNGVVFTVIVVFKLIKDACSRKEAHTVRDALAALLTVIVSGIFYLLVVWLFLRLFSVGLLEGSYMSLSNAWTNDESLLSRIISLFLEVKDVLWSSAVAVSYQWLVRIINAVTIVLALFMAMISLKKNGKLKSMGSLYVAVLFALYPVAADYVRLFNQTTHSCHFFGIWMLYLLPVVLYDAESHKGIAGGIRRYCPVVIAGLIILNNIQVSNVSYLKKHIDWTRISSVMTDVLNRVSTTDGYREGVTKVAFIGCPADALMPAYITTSISQLAGMDIVVMSNVAHYRAYSEFILGRDRLLFCEDSELSEEAKAAVSEMETYPDKGAVKLVDDVAVVRFK